MPAFDAELVQRLDALEKKYNGRVRAVFEAIHPEKPAMPETCACWKCGNTITDLFLPLPRLAECPHCRSELHVCRMCVWFDTTVANQCREPVADPVADKQRANFCGYFRIDPDAFSASSGESGEARRRLEALFGGETTNAAPDIRSPEDMAREQLEKLFGK